jgi:hypothetical protein
MADILDTIAGAPPAYDFPLEQLTTEAILNKPAPPPAAVRNRAATAAMLDGDPAKAIEKYQSMVAEGQNGGDTQAQGVIDAFHKQDSSLDMKAIMSVLADPKLTIQQKQGAVDAVKGSAVLKDSGTSLLTKNLAEGSVGETQEAEDARTSTASALNEIYKSKETIQGLVNAHGASLNDGTSSAIVDMFSAVLAPFATSARSFKFAKAVAEANGQKFTAWDAVKAATIGAGNVTEDARKNLESMSPTARVAYAKTLIDVIQKNSGLLFANDNQYAQFMKATQIFEEGGYSTAEKYIDNVTFLLDAIGVGQILKGGGKAVKAKNAAKVVAEDAGYSNRYTPKNDIVDVVQRIETNSVVRQENPASVASTANQSNPEKARGFHEAVFKSSDDTISEATHGTTKDQAIINDVFPQASTGNGVTATAADIQRNLRLDENLTPRLKQMLRESDVAIHYSLEEKAAARAQIIRDYSSATDLVPVDAMGGFEAGFKLDGSGLKISAVYGTKEGAFVNAQEAYQQALYGLRNQGILPSEVEVLAKQGLDYVPVDLKAVGNREGSYLVRINTERMIGDQDIAKFETENVKRNFFDRSPVSVWNQNGSVSRWMFDAASMLSPRYTGAAVVATDLVSHFEKEMLHIADAYAKQYNSLAKVRKAKIDEYIKEANFKGLPFDQADLVGRGFHPEEIDTLRSWRDFWDSHFYLENNDVIRSLNNQGYQMFKTPSTELYAKPVSKNSNVGKVFDPASGMVLELSQVALDDLYAKGGTLAKLRRPTEFTFGMPYKKGVKQTTASTEYMIVRNTPTEYLRKFRDSDQVLNYREGYYQLQYKAPRFVDELTMESGRVVGRRAVAVAGDTAEAERFAVRQRRTNPDKQYEVRADDKAVRRGGDDWFDLNATSGRIAQKHRGKLLEDATGINHLGDGTYIVNPVESATRAAKSISGRTVTRPMLETAKSRFISQYWDSLPDNGFGGKRFPSTPGEIGSKGGQFSKQTADARTTWEYIHYLENGYINSVDEFFKQQFNAIGQALGELGMSRTERAVMRSTEVVEGPMHLGKNLVFQAYIALNPLRQWIVQTNQIVRTMSYSPQTWLTGSGAKLLGEYAAVKGGFGGSVSAEGRAFAKFLDSSGLLQSVDKQNLIRGSLIQAADSSNQAVRVASEIGQAPRKIGFDAAEMMNLMGHGAAVFDKYRRAGKDVNDLTVMRDMHSELRAISYDMNFAGDMVYNQTSPALVMQFLQVPHKALLQATNRRIPRSTRAWLLAGDIALFGVPTAMISAVLGGDVLPDHEKTRQLFTEGLESFILNNALSQLMGEETDVDFSTFSPESLDGWAKIFHGMIGEGMGQVVMNSPAGQLFLAEGGRFQNAVSQMAKFMSPWEPGERTQEEAVMVVNEIAKISSGWNNAMKMKQALALKKSLDKNGVVIDPNVNNAEAIMQLFGFATGDTKKMYESQRIVIEGSKKHKEDVLTAYKSAKQYHQSKFESGITSPAQQQAVIGQMLMMYKDDPVALDIINREWSKDSMGKDQMLLMGMIKSVGLRKYSMTIDEIKQSPIPDDHKEILIQRLTDAKNARTEINKGK